MTEWQDISTAPRDETEVLVAGGSFMAIARWVEGLQDWYDSEDELGFVPTHWTPLPEPPDHKD